MITYYQQLMNQVKSLSEDVDSFGIPMNEVSFYLNDFRFYMLHNLDEIALHLAKLYLFPNLNSAHHWKVELKAWAKKIRKMRTRRGSKKPNYQKEDLIEFIYNKPFHTQKERDEIIQELNKDYPIQPHMNLNDPSFKEFVLKFIDHILDVNIDFGSSKKTIKKPNTHNT